MSGLIAWVTRTGKTPMHEVPSHTGIGFYDEATNEAVYYESLFGDNWFGPIGLVRLQKFVEADDRRWVRCWWAYGLDAEKARAFCEKQLFVWQYGRAQLLFLWALIRLGIPIRESPNAVTCSEAVSRVIQAGGGPDLPALLGKTRHDYVLPVDIETAADKLLWTVADLAQIAEGK